MTTFLRNKYQTAVGWLTPPTACILLNIARCFLIGELELHGSTEMYLYSPEGAEFVNSSMMLLMISEKNLTHYVCNHGTNPFGNTSLSDVLVFVAKDGLASRRRKQKWE